MDWHEASAVLEPGDVVLAFSDGLIDLYPGTLQQALDQITTTIQAAADAADIVCRFADRAHAAPLLDDDVTVLAIRRLP